MAKTCAKDGCKDDGVTKDCCLRSKSPRKVRYPVLQMLLHHTTVHACQILCSSRQWRLRENRPCSALIPLRRTPHTTMPEIFC